LNPRKQMVSIILLVFVSFTALAACQRQTPQVKSYSTDGLMGLSDVNPNLPTSPTHHTYTKDTDLMRATVYQVPYVIGSSITINGDIATVRLDVPVDLPDREAAEVEREAYERLTQMMPRYTVKIAVSHK
jgi:hypothetical protein